MRQALAAWLLGVVATCAAGASQPVSSGILDLGADRATRAVVTLGEAMPELESRPGLESEMTRFLKGVLADLSGKSLQELRACVPPNPFLGDTAKSQPVCTIHLNAGTRSKRLDVVRTADGNFVAIDTSPPSLDASSRSKAPARAELRRDQFLALFWSWPAYRAGFDADIAEPRPEVFELPKPYTAGRFVMDDKTMEDRFLNGAKSQVPPMDRILDQEKLYCRLPRGYDPRTPAGLLVWLDASNVGQPPRQLWAALDDLNLVCIGAAESGNTRPVSTREQLAFDGAATAMQRYHIDPRRVYITGISGGGRVSSMLLACFPDFFTGAAPIVGLSCYAPVPTGTGAWWPRGYVRPKSDLFKELRSRRIAGITGQKDFNQIEMEHAADIMRHDGVQVRLFEYPDMSHEMPTPERFLEAMTWVDEPWRSKRNAEEAAAKKAWDGYTARFGERKPEDEQARKMLVKVTDAGPWTAEAWRAAALLGLAPATPPTR